MNKRLLSVITSLLITVMLIFSSFTAFAEVDELEIGDIVVPGFNDEEVFEGNVRPEELVDNLYGNEAPINPEWNRVRATANEDKNYGLRIDPLKVNTNYDLKEEFQALKVGNYPASYDLRALNRVTAMRNQGPNGSCWAFASYGSAESVLMPEVTDFSEKNLRNTHGYDWGPDQGGTWQVASAYLTRGSGPIAEKDEPYSPYGFTSPQGLRRVKDVDKIMNVPDMRNGFDNFSMDAIKETIVRYGGLYTSVNADESYLNSRTMGSYNPGYGGYANHAVTIVGWDDNFSRYNFGITPPGDGAWIIKNSWGSNWQYMGGYYYVSYHDAFAGRTNACFKFKNMKPNEEIWYYDYLGMTSNYGNGETAYFANVFGPVNSNKDVYEVGFYVPSNGARYEIYLTSGNGQVSFLNRTPVASGTAEWAGYVTVPIKKYTVSQGQLFAPIVKLTTPGYNYPIPVENPINFYSSRARANRGESYISYNGQNWTDFTTLKYNSNVCVKAMTVPAGSAPTPTVKKVTSIRFNENPLELKVGASYNLNPEILPADAANKSLNYSVYPTNVATVNGGVLRALRAGTATVTATATDGSNVSARFTLNVKEVINEVKATSISIYPSSVTLNVGEQKRFLPTVYPANTTNKQVRWSSTNKNVATVDANGNVVAKGAGTATITATAVDGSGVTGNATVTVKASTPPTPSGNGFIIRPRVQSETLAANQSQVITVNVADNQDRILQYVKTDIKITTPTGNVIARSAYTNNQGNANFTIYSSSLKTPGEYTVDITCSGGRYDTTTSSITFEVEDSRPTFTTTVTPQVDSIQNNGQIKLNIKTMDGNRYVSYADVKTEITTADGVVHTSTGRTNYYGVVTYNYSPNNGPVGDYQVKVTASKNGYKDSVGTATFKVTRYISPHSLELTIASDKESYDSKERANFTFQVVDGNGKAVSSAPIVITVTGPNNFKTSLTKYTDYYGRAVMYIQPNNTMADGQYKISAQVTRYNYEPGDAEYTVTFGNATPDPVDPDPVEPDPVDPDPVEPGETIYKMIETDEAQKMIEENKGNENFVVLDVRTKAEYNESHIDGVIHHDYYAKDHADFLKTLDKNKTYLLYCRTQVRSGATAEMMKDMGFKKIYWMNGGMTKWLRENRPSVFPEYEKALDLNIQTPNAVYNTNSQVKANVTVTDLEGNYVRKADVALALKDANGRTVDTQNVQSGNTGEVEVVFNKISTQGRYTIEAVASYNDFKKANGLAMFSVGTGDKSFTSRETRERNGEYSHLDKTSFEYESLNKNYGKNILQYFVKDANLGDHRLEELVDPEKKTVLVFGYPGCGACVDMWKAMAPLPHDKYNFIEVVTSVEEDVKSTVDFVDRVLKDLNIEQFKDHIYYDADEKIWASRLGFLTTPNTVVLDENGRLLNIAGALDKDGLYSLLKKTLNLDVEEGGDEPSLYNARLDLSFDKPEIKQNERITMTAKLYDMNGNPIRNTNIRYTFEYPNNSYQTGTYDRNTSYSGITNLYFTPDSNTATGTYKITIEVLGDNYIAEKVTKTFEVIGTEPENNVVMNLTFGGTSFKPGQRVNINLYVKDSNGTAIRNEGVKFTFFYPDGKSYEYNKTTSYYGQASITYSPNANEPLGKYTVKAELTGSYSGNATEGTFMLVGNEPNPDPDPDPSNQSLSYNDRYNRGEFNHLTSGDLLPKLKNAYGTNVKGYTLTNMSGQSVTIGSLMDGRRPTVIAMGYPECGGCQGSWKSLVNINKSSFNMVEAMTSGNTYSIDNILNRLGLTQMRPYFHYNARTLFNLISSNYVPCLMYLDKDGNITNLSYFESNAQVLQIVGTIGDTVSK